MTARFKADSIASCCPRRNGRTRRRPAPFPNPGRMLEMGTWGVPPMVGESPSTTNDLLATIREENLNVYRASPQRLREDVGQENQIAQDYRGRLIYELLQNADDAMAGTPGDA